jgi:serine/threonine-protein kinase
MAFLTTACAGDADLLREALSLIRQHDPAFLETPVLRVATAIPRAIDANEVRVGPYRIVRPLGRGGMGDVFLAVGGGEDFRQSVAIKLVREGVNTSDVLRRFREERRILASLNHPNIARLLDGGATDTGDPYFVMEYVDGVPIDAYCDRERMSVPERLRVLQQICDAVQHAHRNLVVHRDIKPSNILVTSDGVPKLLDFGISKVLDDSGDPEVAAATTKVFTPRYASPEQMNGEPLTTATDVFSLGVVLYELLSGTHPYERTAPGDISPQSVESVPPPSLAVIRGSGTAEESVRFTERRGATPLRVRRELSGDLDRIVMKAIHRDSTRRYPSPGALAEDLDRYLAGRPVLARPDSLAYRTGRFVRRNPWAAVASVLGLVAVGLAIGFPMASARQMEVERDRALEVQGFLLEVFGASGAGRERGDTLTAGELLDRQAGVLEMEYGNRPELHAAMSVVLAEGYERLGMFGKAAELAERAVHLYRERTNDDDPDLAAALNMLGWTQFRLGELDRGGVNLRQAAAMRRALGGHYRRELARSLNDLGVLFEALGQYDSAAAMHAESMEIRRAVFGPEHRSTAVSASNLAVIHYRQGRFADAARLGEFAVQGLEAALGRDHQRTAIASQNLAAYRVASGDLTGARDTYVELLERQSQRQGRSHPVTVGIIVSAAITMRRLGEYEQAGELLREALGYYEQQFGPNHERVASTLASLAAVTAGARGMDEAEPMFARAVALMADAYGPTNPAVAEIHISWGELWSEVREYHRAADQFRRAVEINEHGQGADHHGTIDARLRLAHALRRAERLDEAATEYATLHDLVSGEQTRDRLDQVRIGWARVLFAQGDTARADSLFGLVRAFVNSGQAPGYTVELLEEVEGLVAGPM